MEFQVFKDGKVVDKFALSGAYLFGTDGMAIRQTQIIFKNGVIDCRKQNLATAGLALLWPVEGFGSVLLPTTCLPEKAQPYNLNVEITRAKLMQIINKREDWSFFGEIESIKDVAKEAQGLFIQSIQNISNPPLAARLADESLKKAMVISEKLAIEQAESLFNLRSRNHGFGRGCMGCVVDPSMVRDAQYMGKLLELFTFVTVPVNWARIEKEEGDYDFSELDACIEILSQKRLSLSAGPLLCFSKEYLPKWLLDRGNEFEKIRDAAYRFVLQIVGRYAGSIRAWRTVSGLNMFNHFGFSFEQVLEVTRAASMGAKAGNEKALKIVEISNPWGEYYATIPGTIPPIVYMDMVVQSGVNFDAFGLKIRFGGNQDGMYTRDMMHLSAILDYFLPLGRPLHITDVEVPGDGENGLGNGTCGKPPQDGWDQSRQSQWIEQFYKIAFSKSFVDSITYSNLADNKHGIIPSSGLLTEKLEPKKSFRGLKKLRGVIFSR